MDEDGGDGDDSGGESRGSEPRSLQAEEDWDSWTDSEVDLYTGGDCAPGEGLKTEADYEGDWEEEEGDDEDEEEWSSTEYLQALTGLFPLLQKGQPAVSCGSEKELEYLRDGESRTSARIHFRRSWSTVRPGGGHLGNAAKNPGRPRPLNESWRGQTQTHSDNGTENIKTGN